MEQCADETVPVSLLLNLCLLCSPKMDVEPVANVEILNLQKWLEKPKEWKMMKKWIENTAGGGITAKECNPIYIYYIYILLALNSPIIGPSSTKCYPTTSSETVKFYMWNFTYFLRTYRKKSQQSLFPCCAFFFTGTFSLPSLSKNMFICCIRLT